jgi:hypothetical protein
MGVGYYHWHRTSDIGFFAKHADASAIGSCAPLASAFVDGTYNYVYKEHVATEDVGWVTT